MIIYKVVVKQEMKDENGEWVDKSFTDYHDSMEHACYVAMRFKDCDTGAELEHRHVLSIKITTIHVAHNGMYKSRW